MCHLFALENIIVVFLIKVFLSVIFARVSCWKPLFLIIYTRSYCIFLIYLHEYICLHYFLFTCHLYRLSPVSILSFLNALQLFAQTSHSILHFQARWSIDSGKRYCWQLWPKLKLVKYHPAAPETGKQRKRTEKSEKLRGRKRETSCFVRGYLSFFPFFRRRIASFPRNNHSAAIATDPSRKRLRDERFFFEAP